MRRGSNFERSAHDSARRTSLKPRVACIGLTLAWVSIFCAGCFLPTGSSGSDGGTASSPFTTPTLELTVSGVHFGPAAPDSGSSASLETQRDSLGNVTGSTFTLNASVASLSAGCNFSFATYGSEIAVGQYTISSEINGTTPSGIVYPSGAESVQTPEGPASCAGADCDSGAFVITSVDAAHVYGYVQETVNAASGAGQASIVCTFYVPMSAYSP